MNRATFSLASALLATAAPVTTTLAQCSPQTIGTLPEPSGWYYALDEDVFVGGYPYYLDQRGIAYVYERDENGVWSFVQEIQGHDVGWLTDFGSDVAVSGGVILVGADHWDAGGGAVYSFERNGNGLWTEVFEMGPPDAGDCDEDFGTYVKISGGRTLISAAESCDGGAAYIMARAEDGTWSMEDRLHASDSRDTDFFGSSLDIDGNLAAVGMGDWIAWSGGRAFVFARGDDGTWHEEAILNPPPTPGRECWATSVSIAASGVLMVQASYAIDEDDYNYQRVFIYGRDVHGLWTFRDELLPEGLDPFDPISIAAYDDLALVGNIYDDLFGLNVGAVHVFRPDANGHWPEFAAFVPEDFDGGYSFGSILPASGHQAGIFGHSPPPESVLTMYDLDLAPCAPDCPPDLNLDGQLDLFDFLAFVNLFNGEDPAADCDHSGTLDLFDFLCFTNAFNAGC